MLIKRWCFIVVIQEESLFFLDYFIVVIKLNYTTLEMTRFAINYSHQNNK